MLMQWTMEASKMEWQRISDLGQEDHSEAANRRLEECVNV